MFFNNFILGSARKTIYTSIYVYMVFSFSAMELYMYWTSFQKNRDGTAVESPKRDNIFSMTVIFGFASQFILDFVVPREWKVSQYYVFKVFTNNLVFFILVPLLMALKLGYAFDHTELSGVSFCINFKYVDFANFFTRRLTFIKNMSTNRVYPEVKE